MAVEILGCITLQVAQTDSPFIEGQNVMVAAPGFLGTLLLWIYQRYRAKVLVGLSVVLLLISSFLLVALLLTAVAYGGAESVEVDALGVVVLLVYLVCNVVTVFQYRKE
ncbi:hypothetical protein EJV47_16275 [Hymenobacter gummosus]|uniref:Uncharacterized protein n=2 Tax=Hymenobacter gummosus TaxID=1776032 RepID=A0A3S0QH09_9BACT|nr:hypothetical protein EJV47_16275 [Hymenobacter gummosus]